MANIVNYGSAQAQKCMAEEGYKTALAELSSMLKNSNCEGELIKVTSPSYGYLNEEFANNYYTCPAFVDVKYEIGETCSEGYEAQRSLTLKGGMVTECIAIVTDATAGEYVSGACSAEINSTEL